MYIFRGYNSYLPTIPIYPNNNEDLQRLKQEMNKRSSDDIPLYREYGSDDDNCGWTMKNDELYTWSSDNTTVKFWVSYKPIIGYKLTDFAYETWAGSQLDLSPGATFGNNYITIEWGGTA